MEYTLFTGITGELGRAIAASIHNTDSKAACVIRKDAVEYDIDLSRFKVLKSDIADRRSLFKYTDELRGKVCAVVHMASVRAPSPREQLRNVIVNGSLNLYDFANEIGCPRFIFLSSILAAGWKKRGSEPIDEEYIPDTGRLCYFGRMKLLAEERLLERACHNSTKLASFRVGNIYGPPTKLSFIKFVADMIRERKSVFYNRAKNSVMWAPIYIQDAIECIFLLTKKDIVSNEVYFLTGSEYPELEELTRRIAKLMNAPTDWMETGKKEKLHLAIAKTADRVRSIIGREPFPDYVYSNKKLERDIGFIPKTTLAEGLPLTVGWALSKGTI